MDKSRLEETFSMLWFFRTQPCPKVANPNVNGPRCDNLYCFYFHNYEERRRMILAPPVSPQNFTSTSHIVLHAIWTFPYSARSCNTFRNSGGKCKYGDLCLYSHGITEHLYHPELWRQRPCTPQTACRFKRCCAFFHPNSVPSDRIQLSSIVLSDYIID